MDTTFYSDELLHQLTQSGVDVKRVLTFLKDLNQGVYDTSDAKGPYTLPDIRHPAIINRRTPASLNLSSTSLHEKLGYYEITQSPEALGAKVQADGSYLLDESCLETLGILLYPKTAYGVLNGGSASSYADTKKNQALDPELFDQYKKEFENLASLCKNQPKGLTPAFINPDGTMGPSFMLLKLRMILAHKERYQKLTGSLPDHVLPVFQMTSLATDASIQNALDEYEKDPALHSMATQLGCKPFEVYTGIQPMMAALSHSSKGSERTIFDSAYGKPHTGIAMPGGHGQNFEVLTPIYKQLYAMGIKFVWLGNIDNLAFTVEPVSLALLALTGTDAAFEESWRTPIDVKGGILVQDSKGRLTVADIGPAISTQEMLDLEAQGKSSLFNCGIGLFNLDVLVPLLDTIPFQLPLRITDQDKDAGKYAQAEQVTWEVVGLLTNPLFFAVEKSKRFLAAKMLMDMILTSLPPKEAEPLSLGAVAQETHAGLLNLLKSEYKMDFRNNRWELAT